MRRCYRSNALYPVFSAFKERGDTFIGIVFIILDSFSTSVFHLLGHRTNGLSLHPVTQLVNVVFIIPFTIDSWICASIPIMSGCLCVSSAVLHFAAVYISVKFYRTIPVTCNRTIWCRIGLTL